MPDSLLVQKHAAVTILTINRPEVRNAVDRETMVALREALEACEDDGTRCIVLAGAGGAFSSGADIRKAMGDGLTPDTLYDLLDTAYGPTLKAIRGVSWPVVAAVDGYAAGIGCDMALACDLRLVSERGKFAELFVRVGLIPDGGGTYLLPRIVGLGKALEMVFTGADVDAEEALRLGLANRVLPSEGFMDAVLQFAQRISQQSPQSLRRGKAAILTSLDSTYAEALAREHQNQREIFTTEDGMEGFRAFMEKRAPHWTGK
jgi:2-(1,2-epoxy-1,2-dihydrophenyl)acetyl-CoA isomerase